MAILIVILAMATSIPLASAQEAPKNEESASSPARTTEPSDGKEYKLPEAEFVRSPSFRSGSLVQGPWSDLNFDGHYFGGNQSNVGLTGGSWTFHGEGWKIAPGIWRSLWR